MAANRALRVRMVLRRVVSRSSRKSLGLVVQVGVEQGVDPVRPGRAVPTSAAAGPSWPTAPSGAALTPSTAFFMTL